ncbi:MAG: hypothetical protein KF729_04775 [Sandaracinaceae bacterium]|nr:hypothetical protein [Sandaracinaceae bacterium]
MRIALAATCGALLAGCVAGGVGDPCLQETVPPRGYDRAETYVELGSAECVTRVCLVTGLAGDPRAGCTVGCASEDDVRAHVYCSCRCDEQSPTPPCACPDGFACRPAGRAGSYCMRDPAP